jgi:hypothetical protein
MPEVVQSEKWQSKGHKFQLSTTPSSNMKANNIGPGDASSPLINASNCTPCLFMTVVVFKRSTC